MHRLANVTFVISKRRLLSLHGLCTIVGCGALPVSFGLHYFGRCGQKLPDSRFVFAGQSIETVPWGFVYDQFRPNRSDVIAIRSPVWFLPSLAVTVSTRLPLWTQKLTYWHRVPSLLFSC